MLSTLGRALPGSEVTRLSSDAANEVQSETLPREAWIAWYFMAALRAEPFETGSLKNACARAAAMTHSLVAEQNGYHKSRLERSRRADRNIAHLGQWFFIATVVVAILKFTGVYESHDWMLHDGGLIGGFLSAGAGAFVGVRAYAEFSLLARQSARMLNVLKTVSEDLDLTSLDRPLASRQLGGIMSTLATNMMQDISGWAQLFRIKTIESG